MANPHSMYNKAKKEEEVRKLEELEVMKDRVRWNHMTKDEKIEKHLSQVLSAFGIEPSEPELLPVLAARH